MMIGNSKTLVDAQNRFTTTKQSPVAPQTDQQLGTTGDRAIVVHDRAVELNVRPSICLRIRGSGPEIAVAQIPRGHLL
jgi:hypothetical protein